MIVTSDATAMKKKLLADDKVMESDGNPERTDGLRHDDHQEH